jgi:hemolysin-activating ACP:hemolysin acyltransferase
MTTSQILNPAPTATGAPASIVDGLKSEITRDLSAHSNGDSTSSTPSNGIAGDKPTGITEKIRRDAAALRNALAFTQAVGVLMRSPRYRKYTLGDLEWLVIPPLVTGQFRIGEAKSNNNQGPTVPVAIVLWASVSPEVDKRLMEGDDASFQLKPEEWKSGDILWLAHMAGETRFVRFVVDQLMKTTFKGREVKVRGRDQAGNLKVHVLKDTPEK